jgi:hypothetical protein
MRRATALDFAEAHLAGPHQEDESRNFVCRKCVDSYHTDPELEPTAFCNTCAFDVLDMLAEAVVNAAKKASKR